MCRNIRPLFNFEPPATEKRFGPRRCMFVRKMSGFDTPSRANEAAFYAAVDDIARVAGRCSTRSSRRRPRKIGRKRRRKPRSAPPSNSARDKQK